MAEINHGEGDVPRDYELRCVPSCKLLTSLAELYNATSEGLRYEKLNGEINSPAALCSHDARIYFACSHARTHANLTC
jgi:hypothetical protein